MKLSVVLATFNEEQNIGRCLQAVKGWADEIIVVDGSSSDRTREMAMQLGATVIKTTNKPIFHINKQKALDKAKGEWIVQLDADEVVKPELRQEIDRIIEPRIKNLEPRIKKNKINLSQGSKFQVPGSNINGYFVPRKNYFLGRWLKKGGQYPDYVIRLVRKGKARFPCQSVHEQIQVDGEVGYLHNPLDHFTTPTVERYWANANRYTSLTAADLKNQNTPLSALNLLNFVTFKPLMTFLSIYFRHKGFLDGFPGLLFALFSALHWPIAYFKLYEIKNLEIRT